MNNHNGNLSSRTHLILDQIIQNLKEGVNVVNLQGQIIYTNATSARYANTTIENMLGKHVTEFYPKAALLKVLETREPILNVQTDHPDGRHYVVDAYPLILEEEFKGGLAIFWDITDIKEMDVQIKELRSKLINQSSFVFDKLIGYDGSLKDVVFKASRTVGALAGPRHCIIIGETGTGKTHLANVMYQFAKEIGVMRSEAPFVEINCAQFTNPDVAASEIFGSSRGAFTGATDKMGLIELADNGILFLDEAHALDQYQSLLLKVIDEQKVRRIGGRSEKQVNVVVIAASTQDLKSKLLPELYQRLAQYQLYLPSFNERPYSEKEQLLQLFKMNYQKAAHQNYGLDLEVIFEPEVRERLLTASYSRNVRHFKDIVNATIDAATPLINNLHTKKLVTYVKMEHLPQEILPQYQETVPSGVAMQEAAGKESIDQLIEHYVQKGLGPRKIAHRLQEQGLDIQYYQVAYKLKKLRQGE